MSFVGMKTKKRPRSSLRTHNNPANRPQPTAPITVTSWSGAGSVLTINFDQAVSLKGVPQYTTDVAGAEPISAALTSPTILALTFDAAVAAAVELNIPYEDPAVRNSSGGFVTPIVVPK